MFGRSPKASYNEVKIAYQVICGRTPQQESEITSLLNKSNENVIKTLLSSREFVEKIFLQISNREIWDKDIFDFNVEPQMRTWMCRYFVLDEAGSKVIVNSNEWLSIIQAIYCYRSTLKKYKVSNTISQKRFINGLKYLIEKNSVGCGVLDHFDGTYISGWAFNPLRTGEPALIDFYYDGTRIHSAFADEERSDVRSAGVYSEPCGFRTKLPSSSPEMSNKLLEARIRETGRSLSGSPKLGIRPRMLSVILEEGSTQLDPAYQTIEDELPDLFYERMRAPNGKIAVVLHLFYPELWTELNDYLHNIQEDFDLFISLVKDKSEEIKADILIEYPEARILVFPNHGRDVFPFSEFANSGMLDSYELICKIHGKRSLHRRDGEDWRKNLFGGLLGSKETVAAICKKMRSDPDIGLVVPNGYIYEADALGDNIEGLSKLLSKVNLTADFGNLTFPAGNMFWIQQSSFQWLKSLKLNYTDFELEGAQLDSTIGHAVERYIGIACEAAHQKQLTTSEVMSNIEPSYHGERHTLIAFYLPQYHPIAENDSFWGKGFTEWHNVHRASAQYLGHYQPRRPTELGYYDLRLDQVRLEQANLANQFGVNAFCYYYYWFDGKPVLNTPLDSLISNPALDFPFCICWANENWTRSWDGMNRDILMPQSYDPKLIQKFAEDISPYLLDKHYLKHLGKPIFIIYKITDIPDAKSVIKSWREIWRQSGIGEVHIATVRTFDAVKYRHPIDLGVDSFIDFPPHSITNYAKTVDVPAKVDFNGFVYDYVAAQEGDIARYEEEDSGYVHRGVMAAWDNTARRGAKAHIAHGASPMTYRSWLRRSILQDARRNPSGERLMFINAWNEWAEGTYLEPDERYGRAFLVATKSARS